MRDFAKFLLILFILATMPVAVSAATADYDPTFGSAYPGRVTATVSGYSMGGNAVVSLPDGKSVVAGWAGSNASSTYVAALSKFTSTGALDINFGVSGVKITGFDIGAESINSIVALSDGRLVVAGKAKDGALYRGFVARLMADGNLDYSFGNSGSMLVPGTGNSQLSALLVLQDGSIVAGGSQDAATGTVGLIIRFSSDGVLAGDFACPRLCDGRLQLARPAGMTDVSIAALAVQGDGKLVTMGTGVLGAADSRMLIYRINAQGTLDSSFAGTGTAIVSIQSAYNVATSGLVLPDGRILVAGYSAAVTNAEYMSIARLTSSGTLDTSFGAGGVSVVQTNNGGRATSLLRRIDGKLYLSGWTNHGGYPYTSYRATVVRLTADGAFDALTARGGRGSYAGCCNLLIQGAALDSSGRLLLAGAGDSVMQLMRLRNVATEVLVTPEPIVLPSVSIGGQSSVQVTVSNPGPVLFSLAPPTFPQGGNLPFSIEANTCNSGLDAGQSCTFSVRFMPTAYDIYLRSVAFFGNFEGGEAPLLIALRGEVVDTTPPETTLTAAPSGTITALEAEFSFTSSEASRFECSLDGGNYFSCQSPYRWKLLPLGGRTFTVRAVDLAGNIDPTPAQATFTVSSGSNSKIWMWNTSTTGLPETFNAYYLAPPAVINVQRGAENEVTVALTSPLYTFSMKDRFGAPLAPGYYGDARANPVLGAHNGLTVSSSFSGCASTYFSSFNIHEIAYNPDGSVQSLAADVQVSCSYGPRVFAELRFNSSVQLSFQRAGSLSTPNPFSFQTLNQALPGSMVLSNEVTVYGVFPDAPITVSGGEYRLDGGTWTSVPGTVRNGARVQVRVTASAALGGSTTATLNVGGYSAPFQVTTYLSSVVQTVAQITTQNPNVNSIRLFESKNSLIRASTDAGNNIYIQLLDQTGSKGLQVRGPGGVRLQQGVYERVRPINHAGPGAVASFASSCLGYLARMIVHEVAYNPDGSILRLALDYEYRCGSNALITSEFGEIRIASTVPLLSQKSAGSIVPSAFAFVARSGAGPGQIVESNSVTVQGVNAPTQVSITGGEFRINGGAWTTAPALASNRDVVTVRTVASQSAGGLVTAALTIGGITSNFDLRTHVAGTPQTAIWYRSYGDFVGGGRSEFIDLTTDPIQIYPGSEYLSVISPSLQEEVAIRLGPPRGAVLAPGAYEMAYGAFTVYSARLFFNLGIRGCSLLTGRFVVHEVAFGAGGSVDFLAADLEYRCNEDPQLPLYAEVRWNSSVPFTFQRPASHSAPVAFAPGIRKAQAPGVVVESDLFTIYGINTPAALSITGGEYSINGGPWATSLSAVTNGSRIKVRTTASSLPGGIKEVVLTVGGVSGTFRVETYQSGTPQSVFRFVSPNGEPLGEGKTELRDVNPPGIEVNAGPNNGIGVFSYAALDRFSMYFAAPGGSVMNGAYENTVTSSFSGTQPVLSISARNTSCTGSGRFVVRELVYAGNGQVEKLAIDFQIRCFSNTPLFSGEIRFNSSVPLQVQESFFSAPTVTVSRVGTGSGLVFSAPSGILCGADCSEVFSTGASVSLAQIAEPGSVFVGWEGVTCAGGNSAATCAFTLLADTVISARFNLASQVQRAAHDLDGSGKSDIVWRNSSTGTSWYWAMNGATISAQGPITTLPVDWQIQSTAVDFDGDGKSDILLRNMTTGQPWVWFMNGNSIIGGGALPTLSDLNWTIAGTGDLNGDGKGDVIWRNTSTGQNWWWALNGTTIISQGEITGLPVDWAIQSTLGDFNGDGKTDILWRNTTTGQPWVWMMDGNTITTNGSLPTLSDLNWTIAGTGDLNGDGKHDVVWRNTATGANWYWALTGTVITAQGPITTLPADWQIQSTSADFDGDGKADILLRNMTTGQPWIWFMNGNSITGGGPLPTLSDMNWQVRARK